MPLLPRNPEAASSSANISISKAYGGMVLLALVILIAMRHLFGSIHVEGGVR